MREKYETYAYFYVSDFEGHSSLITKNLGILPSKIWHKGDDWLPNKKRTYSSWEVHSSANRSEIFLEVHIKSVLDTIEPKISEILELKDQGCKIGINCVGYYTNANPGFGLSAELISRLAKFSIDIDFDLYCFCDDNLNDDENNA